jgi:hypothetical protein
MKICRNHGEINSGTVRHTILEQNARYLLCPAVRQALGAIPCIAWALCLASSTPYLSLDQG